MAPQEVQLEANVIVCGHRYPELRIQQRSRACICLIVIPKSIRAKAKAAELSLLTKTHFVKRSKSHMICMTGSNAYETTSRYQQKSPPPPLSGGVCQIIRLHIVSLSPHPNQTRLGSCATCLSTAFLLRTSLLKSMHTRWSVVMMRDAYMLHRLQIAVVPPSAAHHVT